MMRDGVVSRLAVPQILEAEATLDRADHIVEECAARPSSAVSSA